MASPQLQQIKQMFKTVPLHAEFDIEQARAAMEQLATLLPTPQDVKLEPVDAGGVPAEWVSAPNADPDRVIYYLHGGGYVMGSIKTHREMVSRIARACEARALIIDYRLAPENPFPAALEDATKAYRWLLSTGIDPSRLIIAGDSAGGGLTVATLLALRDAGDPLPAAAVCLSPWTDLEATGESIVTNSETDPWFTAEQVRLGGQAYLGGADPHNPLAAPLYADLNGLPSMLVQAGGAEMLLDDSRRLVDNAKRDGVDVTLDVWPDMIHVWQAFAMMLPEGQQAIDRIGEFVRARTGAKAAAG